MARFQDRRTGAKTQAASRRGGRGRIPSGPAEAEAAGLRLGTGPVPHPAGGAGADGTALVFVLGGRVIEPSAGDGRALEEGELALFDGVLVRQSWLSDGRVLTLPLDRAALSGRGWPDGTRDMLLLPRSGTEVLRDLLESLARHAGGLSPGQAATASATVVALLRDALDAAAGAAADGAANAVVDAPPPDKRQEVLAFVDANLGRPDLTPEAIAAGTGLSRSVLYRLLAAEGGVAACVKRRRLDAMRRALAARDDPRSIAEIAADTGFSDPSHAHRAFREAFGVTPGDVRRDGPRPATGPADPPPEGRPVPPRSGGCSG